MSRHFTIFIALLFLTTACLEAFELTDAANHTRALNYLDEFKDLAVEEMHRTGIPASIKLAQGMFESGFGQSILAREANNHFGIKCKTEWTGDTILYTDDSPDECFRKYPNASESYKDHSEFLLTRDRYAFLFLLPAGDYMGWAEGLKKAGYATDPKYKEKIVRLIKTYKLFAFDVLMPEPVITEKTADLQIITTPEFSSSEGNQKEKAETNLPGRKNSKQQPSKQVCELRFLTDNHQNKLYSDGVGRQLNPSFNPELYAAQNRKQMVTDYTGIASTPATSAAASTQTNLVDPLGHGTVKVSENEMGQHSQTGLTEQNIQPVVAKANRPVSKQKEFIKNGIKAVCYPYSVFPDQIAQTYHYPISAILDFNDLEKNTLIPAKTNIFLASKHEQSRKKTKYHIVADKQTMWEIAQLYGIKLAALYQINKMPETMQPEAGRKIYLRTSPVRITPKTFKK